MRVSRIRSGAGLRRFRGLDARWYLTPYHRERSGWVTGQVSPVWPGVLVALVASRPVAPRCLRALTLTYGMILWDKVDVVVEVVCRIPPPKEARVKVRYSDREVEIVGRSSHYWSYSDSSGLPRLRMLPSSISKAPVKSALAFGAWKWHRNSKTSQDVHCRARACFIHSVNRFLFGLYCGTAVR